MSRVLFHPGLLALWLLPWLVGCAMFNPDRTVPPDPQVVGIAAHNMALQQKVREGHGGQPDVFVPLARARAAVEAARVQPGVDTYAADTLAQARAELARAQQLWAASDDGNRDVSRLARVASHAHNARRLAQIARFTALREINLTQLDDASARLRRLRAAASAPADRNAAGDGARQLIGARVVPGRFGRFDFKPGTAQLTAESQAVVARLAALLENNPEVGVAILGHTASSEPSKQALQNFKRVNPQLEKRNLSHQQLVYAYHLALSNARARAVARALVRSGVSPRRIGARGFGSSRPVAGNNTADGRAANQRVVAVIIPGPDSKGSPLRSRSE